MEINEYLIKFSGAIGIPMRELNLGDNVEFKVMGVIVKTEEKDNQDGTKDKIYIVKITELM